MPLYDTFDKLIVVLDIGTAYTKLGFSGEHAPRWIIRSEVREQSTGKIRKLTDAQNEEELYDLLVDFIHHLYFKYILFNPKDKAVVVVESLLCPTLFRNTLAKVLFVHYEIALLLMLPSHLVSLASLGTETALVVDCGYTEAVTIPVCHGLPVLHAWQALPIGAETIHSNLRTLLAIDNSTKLIESLSENTLEDIKVRCCFVTKKSRAAQFGKITPCPDVNYPLQGDDVIVVTGKTREKTCEILYEEDNDNLSLPTMILDAIMKVDLHLRKKLADNILLIGGTAMLPGFKARLKEELLEEIKNNRYSVLKMNDFKFHNPPCKENYAAWLGGAIYGATELLGMKSLTRENYLKENRLPDWANLRDNLRTL